jgi:hypothetical protein
MRRGEGGQRPSCIHEFKCTDALAWYKGISGPLGIEVLAANPEVPGSIPGATKFSE